MNVRFTRGQKAVLRGMVLAYTAAYLNRLNLGAALQSITAAFELTDAGAGLLQSAFAIVYAAGS